MKQYLTKVEWYDGGVVMGSLSTFFKHMGATEEQCVAIDEADAKLNGSKEIWIEAESASEALGLAAKQIEDQGHRVWRVSFVD